MAKSKSKTLFGATSVSGRALITVVLAGVLLLVTACATTTTPEPVAPEPVSALPDGNVFAMVTVGTDESGATTLGVDLADWLTGDGVREKAVEDGVIEEGEDLPNDFYIDNDEVVMELLHFADVPQIMVISGNDTGDLIEITEDQLVQLWNGDYVGEPVYGIVPSVPIAMDVTVQDGTITRISAVYLP